MKYFTLVSTVFNEFNRLDQTIADIEDQILKPSEIIITDAGSFDGTYERLLEWKNKSGIDIKILQQKNCNVAEGRNFAIKNSSNELIVSTDFGCRFHPEWLASLLKIFENPEVKVVGGNFSVIEQEIISNASKASYVLSNGYNIRLDNNFIPSSRSIAFYKEVWQDAGGYPEWLTLAADDLVFGKVLKRKGYKIYLAPQPYVYWGRHRKASAYGKEAYRYGLGDGEAGVNFRNFISKIIETTVRYLFFIVFIFSLFVVYNNGNKLLLLILVPMLVGFRSYIWAMKSWLRFRSEKYNIIVLFYSLYLIELTRIRYIQGYYKGYYKRTEKQKTEAEKLKAVLS